MKMTTRTGEDSGADPNGERRHWMGVLARALPVELEGMWDALEPRPSYTWLRRPEVGIAQVRGRIGGEGCAFNLGEMTVVRCAVSLEDGPVGVAYVKGRDARHAELAAVFDALLQVPAHRDELLREVVGPLERAQRVRRLEVVREAEPTRVEFFTMERRRKMP